MLDGDHGKVKTGVKLYKRETIIRGSFICIRMSTSCCDFMKSNSDHIRGITRSKCGEVRSPGWGL